MLRPSPTAAALLGLMAALAAGASSAAPSATAPTQMEVSAEVGISQAQVSRLEKGAINTIRKHL